MKTKLRILYLEDDSKDVELVHALLEAGGLDCDLVSAADQAAFEAALVPGGFDLVLSDYTLPQYDGLAALRRVRELHPDLPFILISGNLGEEQAVQCLKSGATDYVLKQRLPRLVPATRRALEDAAKATELKRAEEAMRQSEFKYRQLFESLSDAAFVIDEQNGRILDTNRQAEVLLGKTRSDILGKTLTQFHAATPPGSAPPWPVGNAGIDPPASFKANVLRTDGQQVPVHVTAAPITLHEMRLVLALYRDITELKRIEAQFLRAQRLESIGAMASGIAHDLNNILAPILMGAGILRYSITPEEVERTVATIENSARRGADLIKQLLIFGRGVEGKRTALQPRLLLKEVLKMIQETFPKTIAIKDHLAVDLWPVVADPSQLYQVLLNLCVNARDALPAGGRLELTAQNITLDEHYAGMTPGTQAGPFIRLEVADTGTGIAPEVLDRIFDPFFTTKEPGKGTGLGLSTVLGIVKSHRGFVDVRSQPGNGTIVAVYLPAEPNQLAPALKSVPTITAAGHGELILVVDDEPQIAAITRANLEKHGYRTLVAEEGVAALVAFTQHQWDISALITDLDMPLMGGLALVQAIRVMNPKLPIVVATGIGDPTVLEEQIAALEELEVNLVLRKPFDATALLDALQEALSATVNLDWEHPVRRIENA